MSDGMDWMDGLSYTAMTSRASLQSDANKCEPLFLFSCISVSNNFDADADQNIISNLHVRLVTEKLKKSKG